MQCGLPDGVLYDAVLVGLDKVGDVALIKLLPKKDGAKFPFAAMGDSDKVRAGDWALALGNPFLLATDFTPTVTYVGTKSSDTSGTPEWDLDSQDALAAAGGKVKEMVFYVATSLADAPLISTFNQSVSENRAKVINVSLGGCENGARTSGFTAASDQIFALAVSQGQTFSVSTGDSGSDGVETIPRPEASLAASR